MSLDQILMIPGYSADGGGGGGADFNLSANNLTAGTPVFGTPTLTLITPSETYLPTVTSSPYMGYALRKLTSGYAGSAIRVRRSSDNAEQDIGFSGINLDVSALETFASGTDAFVTTFYEQTTNGVNLTQTTAGNQPQIVASGTAYTNEITGEVEVRSSNKTLGGTHGSTISNQDLDLFIVGRPLSAYGESNVNDALFTLNDINTLRVSLEDVSIRRTVVNEQYVLLGSGMGSDSTTQNSTDQQCDLPGVLGITLDGTDISWHRNTWRCGTTSHVEGALSSNAVVIGGAGDVAYSEIIAYPALSSADRLDVYYSVNAYHQVGPTSVPAETASLPASGHGHLYTAEDWCVELWQWLTSLELADVTFSSPGSLSWDGTYSGLDELSNLWLWQGSADFTFEDIMQTEPEWFIADDGDGGGFYGTGVLRHYRYDNNSGSKANQLAHWYTASFPKSGGAEGNPYYGDSAVAIRAMAQAAIALLTAEYAASWNPTFWQQNDVGGGVLVGVSPAYRKCKSVLSAPLQASFEKAIKKFTLRLWKRHNARRVNANMDCKIIAGLAHAWHDQDATGKAYCVEHVKKILFGSTTGTPATSDANTSTGLGIYDPAGHIREGRSPETTYNGQALNYFCQAYVATKGEADWSFLKTCMDGIGEWIAYQTFLDGSERLGVSGYSGRTDGFLWKDLQANTYKGRNIVCAQDTSTSRYFARYGSAALSGIDASAMSTAITSNVSTLNSSGFGTTNTVEGTNAAHTSGVATKTITLTNTPDLSGVNFSDRAWFIWLNEAGGAQWYQLDSVDDGADTATLQSTEPDVTIAGGSPVSYKIALAPNISSPEGQHWPTTDRFEPSDGWHAALKTLVDASDSTTLFPFDNSADINKSFNDDFWAYKSNDGTLDYGWFVESLDYAGSYQGWYGGKIESFWVEDYGQAIVCLRSEYTLDDRDWDEIELWPTMHTWGYDDAGTPGAFSSAWSDGASITHTSTFSLGTSPPYVEHTVDIGASEGHSTAQESGSEISGTWSPKIKIEKSAAADGCTVTVSYTSDQADDVTELWHSIPIHVLGDGQGISDTDISYWNGASWTALTTTLTSVDWIRLSRNHGAGAKYVFIHFSATQGVKLSASVYQDGVQQSTRIRQIHCDIHPGTTGVATTLLASDSISYDIQTTDPGLTPSAPSVSVTEPVASTVFFTNGFWFSRATITGTGTIAAKLQYSTDSTTGTDGTWTDVSAMTNTTGDTYVYIGEAVAVPSGLTYVRVQATDDNGTTNSPVAATSTTPSLVVNDEFTDTNGTDLDGSYTGFTANTTGNVYEQIDGVAEVQSNMAEMVTDGTWGAIVAIDCGSENAIVQVEIIALSATGGTTTPGNGVYGRVSGYASAERWFIRNTSLGRLARNASTVQELSYTISNGDDFQLTLQMIGNVSVGKFTQLTGGPTTLGYVVDWASVTGSQKFGFCIDNTPGYQTFDNFKIWA